MQAMRARILEVGGHTKVTLFSGPDLERLASNGTLLFASEEWDFFLSLLLNAGQSPNLSGSYDPRQGIVDVYDEDVYRAMEAKGQAAFSNIAWSYAVRCTPENGHAPTKGGQPS